MTHRLFTPPAFTAHNVAEVIGGKLGRPLPHTEGDADADGCVDVTTRVHVQVGADDLVVGAWADVTTLRTWPPRRTVRWAFRDVTRHCETFRTRGRVAGGSAVDIRRPRYRCPPHPPRGGSMARKKKPQPDPTPAGTADAAVNPPEPVTPSAGEPTPPVPQTHSPDEPPPGEPGHAESVRPDGPRVPNPFGFKQDVVAGVRLLEDRRYKQLHLRFVTKPSDEVRAAVAEAGWRWRPHEEHWTRQIDPENGWQTRADADRLFEHVAAMIRAEMGVGVGRV